MRSCWNCGKSLQKSHPLLCPENQCGAIQPVDPLSSYLQVLLPGIALMQDQGTLFDLDMGALRKRYLELQRQVHPDTVQLKSQVG
jgi:uncharacterized protein YijF (DUF1287 family)